MRHGEKLLYERDCSCRARVITFVGRIFECGPIYGEGSDETTLSVVSSMMRDCESLIEY